MNNNEQTNVTGDFGQPDTPEYGAMESQFAPDYNPYVYGAPEPKKSDGTSAQSAQNTDPRMGDNPAMGPFGFGNVNGNQGDFNGMGNVGYPAGPGGYPTGPYPGPQMPRNMAGPLPGQPGYQPDIRNGVDMNDPYQNPLKGRWDSIAIIAFVLAFLGGPVFPLVLGVISLNRTQKFHMKGRGLAWAAIIIGLIVLLVEFWMMSKGYNPMDYLQQLMDSASGGSGDGGGSVSA
jgi:hypothetical protein